MVDFCTDENLFFKKNKCNKIQRYSINESKMAPYPNRTFLTEDSKYKLNKFILRAEVTTKQIIVSFMKISEFLSNVLAILVNTLVILNLIIIPLNEFKALQSISEKVMKIKDILKSENKHLLNYFNEKFKINKTFNIKENFNKRNYKFVLDKFENINDFKKYPKSDFNSKIYIKPNTRHNFIKEVYSKTILKENENINFTFSQHLNLLSKDKNFKSFFENSNSDNLKLNNKKYSDSFLVNSNLGDLNNSNSNGSRRPEVENEKKILINEIQNSKNKSKILNENPQRIENFNLESNINSNKKINFDKAKQIQKIIEKSIILKKNPYKIRMIDLIKYAFNCGETKSKFDFYHIAESTFNQNIDIINYMNKMQEIDILKYLILDNNTIDIMNFIAKPKLFNHLKMNNDNPINKNFFEYNIHHSCMIEDMTNLKFSFDKILQNKNPNIFTIRLMKLFNQEIENINK